MKLIINADDFGLSEGVSQGILEAMKHGVITDTSAIVCAPAFKKCAAMALNQGMTEMGVHLFLTMGRPITSPSLIPSLVDNDGCFYSREAFFTKDIDMKEAQRELEAQIRYFKSCGLTLNHLDSHHGLMTKSDDMAELIMKLAKTYGVPLRNEVSRYRFYTPFHAQKLQGVITPSLTYFNHGVPYHTLKELTAFINMSADQYDVVEIGCHPGYSDAYLRSITKLNDDREIELQLFMSEDIKKLLYRQQISLISYTDLKKEAVI